MGLDWRLFSSSSSRANSLSRSSTETLLKVEKYVAPINAASSPAVNMLLPRLGEALRGGVIITAILPECWDD